LHAFAGKYSWGYILWEAWGVVLMLDVMLGKLCADIMMNGGLYGYGSIDYAILMPQKVRQLMPNQVW
jgi:hypothetical protein